MIEKLKELLKNAYSPYYHFRVASIVVTKDGKEFCGVNVENASPASGVCAERNAIYSAISAGYKEGDFKALHVMVDNDEIGYPCFICRQTISELCDRDMVITLYTSTGEILNVSYDDIIVHPFTEESLS